MAEIITYEGVKYRKVERIAEVGELITYDYRGEYSDTPRKVAVVSDGSVEFTPYRDVDEDDDTFGYINGAYRVLEEITEPQPDVTGLIANLGRRVHELEGADAVNPAHYRQGNIEVIDFIDQVADGYVGRQAVYAGNIIKYVSRAPYKNGLEDVKKSAWYLARLIEAMEAEAGE